MRLFLLPSPIVQSRHWAMVGNVLSPVRHMFSDHKGCWVDTVHRLCSGEENYLENLHFSNKKVVLLAEHYHSEHMPHHVHTMPLTSKRPSTDILGVRWQQGEKWGPAPPVGVPWAFIPVLMLLQDLINADKKSLVFKTPHNTVLVDAEFCSRHRLTLRNLG